MKCHNVVFLILGQIKSLFEQSLHEGYGIVSRDMTPAN